MHHAKYAPLRVALAAAACLACPTGLLAAVSRYDGMSALVIVPENRWDWDAAAYGALASRGFAVSQASPGDLPSLAGFDLVVTGVRRSFPAVDVEKLSAYVSEGGALWGSWGGPFETPRLLKLCRVRGARSGRFRELVVVSGTPLGAGLESKPLVELAASVGDAKADAEGWELVVLDPEPDAITTAATVDGRALAACAEWGRGRTAVLGFGPEMARHFADPAVPGRLMDNLLGWLLEAKLSSTATGCTGRVTLALPAGTAVRSVTLDGDPMKITVARAGTYQRVAIDLSRVRPGTTCLLEARYAAPGGRRVETLVHLPWNTLVPAAASPAAFADWLKWLGVTVCQPLLRGSDGMVWYKGGPGDSPVKPLAAGYRGDFLKDLVRECHARGIRVFAGAYLDNTVVREDPTRGRVDRFGRPVLDQWGRPLACFNHPECQSANLARLRRMLADYELDGLVLDDNFELDQNECFGAYCVNQFKKWCAKNGETFSDPAKAESGPVREAWVAHRRQATRALVRAMAAAAPRGRRIVYGGWTGLTPRPELAGCFDLTGCMAYGVPASAIRLPVAAAAGQVACLLWEPDQPPDSLTADANEAIRSGAAAVGFWIRSADGGWKVDDARANAIRDAFIVAEETWLAGLRENVLAGDPRFEVVEGTMTRNRAALTVRNAGTRVAERSSGPLDVAGLITAPAGAPGK